MLPAATLVASLSEEIVVVVLGERWVLAIPLVAPLTISILLDVLGSPAGTVLTIKGRVKLLAGLGWFTTITGLAIFLVAVQWLEIEELVWLQVGVAFVFLVLFYLIMIMVTKISVLTLLGSFYRPLLASLVMALVIYLVSVMISSAWLVILTGVVAGSSSYLIAATLLWWIAGSPDSGEALLVRKLAKIVTRKLKK
jgi:O-antigen/teichoic acid export membrane protein